MPANTPYIAYQSSGLEPGYIVGTALDELVSWALEAGGLEPAELEERLAEAIGRVQDEAGDAGEAGR